MTKSSVINHTHQPLHLKYRPTQLSQLVGQNLITRTLENAIKLQQIAPAYLFIGNRGTGKTSTARILAKSLNCLNNDVPTVTPCNQCQSCRSIEQGNSLDVTELDAASHNGVDDARQLIEQSHFAPAFSRYRIFILDEIHCLSNQAFNALLKTIEEPPAKTLFILCTTEAHKVLSTIVSRCQVFNFQTISVDGIVSHLQSITRCENIDITDETLTAIARTANGGLRDALQLLSQLSLLNQTITIEHLIEATNGINQENLYGLMKTLFTGMTIEILQLSRRLIDNGKTPQLIINSLLQIYRDLLIVKTVNKSAAQITSSLNYTQLEELAAIITIEQLSLSLQQIQKSESQLRTSINANVWLEVCLLNLSPTTSTSTNNYQQSIIVNGHRAVSQTDKTDKTDKTNKTDKTDKQENKPDLSAIWARVVERVKPSAKSWLSHATLTRLTPQNATLLVEDKYLSKFEHNQDKITRLISKTVGYHIQTLSFIRSLSS